jgi:hypothetical protein
MRKDIHTYELPANSLRNFSKCFTTTDIAHLTSHPALNDPPIILQAGASGRRSIDIVHSIKCKLRLKDMGFIRIRVHMRQG